MTSPHDDNPAIVASNLRLSLGEGTAAVEILRGIDLVVPRGQVLALLGPSGSGKSSLMAVLTGLERATSGALHVAGADFATMSEDQLALARRGRIGIVLQAFHLLPTMTAQENVATPLELAGEADAWTRAAAELEAVGLGHRLTHYPAQLSGGEQQRVAIARALALEPQIMLFDEPTSSLDPELTGEVLNVMRALASEGMTMIVVSHEIGFAASVANRIVFLDGGKLLLNGTPKEVFGQPRHPRLEQFLETYLDRGAAILA